MDQVKLPQEGIYIVAVSGGVDSMALLHLLCKQNEERRTENKGVNLVVAHFDHGIRSDSGIDKQLVEKVARQYGLKFESKVAKLGKTASEELARKERYNFLLSVKQKYVADAIITAHHADDVVETMMINLLRGSGWRGLCSLRSLPELIRPLLAYSKEEIVKYARQHDLQWREDNTNSNTKYLRNDVRRSLMPLVDKQKWLDLYSSQVNLQERIKKELHTHASWRRHDFIMWPRSVALEVLRAQLPLTRPQASHVLMAIKTAQAGHRLTLGPRILTFTREEFMVE